MTSSNNQIDVSSDELNERYRSNDEAKRKIDSEIREMEQAGIATMSAPDQRATEGPRKQREDVLKAKLKDHLSEEQWTAYQGLKSEQRESSKRLGLFLLGKW